MILGIIILCVSIFFLWIGIKIHKNFWEREGYKEWNSDDWGAVIIGFSLLFIFISIQIIIGWLFRELG